MMTQFQLSATGFGGKKKKANLVIEKGGEGIGVGRRLH